MSKLLTILPFRSISFQADDSVRKDGTGDGLSQVGNRSTSTRPAPKKISHVEEALKKRIKILELKKLADNIPSRPFSAHPLATSPQPAVKQPRLLVPPTEEESRLSRAQTEKQPERQQHQNQAENEPKKIPHNVRATSVEHENSNWENVTYDREDEDAIGPEAFVPLRLLGKGSFGEVYLVHRRGAPKELYAMKVLNKKKI